VRVWAAAGDFSPDGLRGKEVYVVDGDGSPVAWAALLAKPGTAWLEDLWVDPAWMGQGIGSRLFRHVVACARNLGSRRLEWEAEPHAVGFYEKLGGLSLRESAPTEWGRVVPVMGIDIERADL
jgi:GNAT superfamily N-acetyltransferase